MLRQMRRIPRGDREREEPGCFLSPGQSRQPKESSVGATPPKSPVGLHGAADIRGSDGQIAVSYLAGSLRCEIFTATDRIFVAMMRGTLSRVELTIVVVSHI